MTRNEPPATTARKLGELIAQSPGSLRAFSEKHPKPNKLEIAQEVCPHDIVALVDRVAAAVEWRRSLKHGEAVWQRFRPWLTATFEIMERIANSDEVIRPDEWRNHAEDARIAAQAMEDYARNLEGSGGSGGEDTGKRSSRSRPKRAPGRPRIANRDHDRIIKAWRSGTHSRYADCAQWIGNLSSDKPCTERDVRLAVEREHKRGKAASNS